MIGKKKHVWETKCILYNLQTTRASLDVNLLHQEKCFAMKRLAENCGLEPLDWSSAKTMRCNKKKQPRKMKTQ